VRQFEKQKTLELDGLIEVFREHWRDESWHEVLRLMAGMLDANFTGKILEYLIGKNGAAEKFSNLFLAAQCVSEVRNRNSIDEIGCKLRDRVKELTRYSYKLNVSSISDIEHNRLVKEIRRQAVAAVAATWKDDPETLRWLKQRAQSDDDWAVRGAAVQEIARGWKDDPETLPILKQRAQSDYDSAVRGAAVQELARGWKDDPETLPILKQLAQSDGDSDVRGAAVQELARAWKDDPELFELLCDVAINDPFDREYNWQDNARQTALAAIIELYPDRPQTLELVRDRAQNDSDETLCKFAQKKLAELERQ
jgi:predicted NACHT family NTPase